MTLQDVFSSPPIADCFTDAALIRGMLAFERELARAEAACGSIPQSAAEAIETVARGVKFDVNALVKDARRAGTLAIPFVRQLTRAVEAVDADAARYVHFGATSQDVVDTALALQSRDASALIVERLDRLGDVLARLADAHRATPTVARTLLQPATPVPFGWKVAVWLDAVARSHRGLRRASAACAAVQFGGASGVLAPLGANGLRVEERLARALALAVPATPWQSMRDNAARLAAELGIVCAVTAKIAGDIALLAQPEVGEAFEPHAAGRGGSSAMPHKRNPVGAMYALEAGRRTPGLVAGAIAGIGGEHERGLGQWQTQFWSLGQLFGAAGSALDAMVEVAQGLVVDPVAMQRNLASTRGLVYAEALTVALAGSLGRTAAHDRVEALCARVQAQSSSLADELDKDAELATLVPPEARRRLFDPASQFGAAESMIDRALAAWRQRKD